MIAEGERIYREKDGKPAAGWPHRVRVQRHAARENERQVQRVDLGDDRLAPEGVREREQNASRDAGRKRIGHQRTKQGQKTYGSSSEDRRKEVQAARRIVEADATYERTGEVVVKRIGLPCADLRP